MWQWLETLPNGAASFLGSLTGASVGLIAILIGALVNAHLNRKRDDALRRADARSVAIALKAELAPMAEGLLWNARLLDDDPGPVNYIIDIAHSVQIMPQLLPKLGLLDETTIKDVTTAYGLIDQYCYHLIMLGGQLIPEMPANQRVVSLSDQLAGKAARINRSRAQVIQRAVARLDAILAPRQRFRFRKAKAK
jgi:hypothetical protein